MKVIRFLALVQVMFFLSANIVFSETIPTSPQKTPQVIPGRSVAQAEKAYTQASTLVNNKNMVQNAIQTLGTKPLNAPITVPLPVADFSFHLEYPSGFPGSPNVIDIGLSGNTVHVGDTPGTPSSYGIGAYELDITTGSIHYISYQPKDYVHGSEGYAGALNAMISTIDSAQQKMGSNSYTNTGSMYDLEKLRLALTHYAPVMADFSVGVSYPNPNGSVYFPNEYIDIMVNNATQDTDFSGHTVVQIRESAGTPSGSAYYTMDLAIGTIKVAGMGESVMYTKVDSQSSQYSWTLKTIVSMINKSLELSRNSADIAKLQQLKSAVSNFLPVMPSFGAQVTYPSSSGIPQYPTTYLSVAVVDGEGLGFPFMSGHTYAKFVDSVGSPSGSAYYYIDLVTGTAMVSGQGGSAVYMRSNSENARLVNSMMSYVDKAISLTANSADKAKLWQLKDIISSRFMPPAFPNFSLSANLAGIKTGNTSINVTNSVLQFVTISPGLRYGTTVQATDSFDLRTGTITLGSIVYRPGAAGYAQALAKLIAVIDVINASYPNGIQRSLKSAELNKLLQLRGMMLAFNRR